MTTVTLNSFSDILLKAIPEYGPFIAVCIAVFFVSAPSSLCFWLAVQQTPPSNHKSNGVSTWTLRNLLEGSLLRLVLYLLFFSGFHAMGRDAFWYDAIWYALLTPVAYVFTCNLLCELSGTPEQSVHRSVGGIPFRRALLRGPGTLATPSHIHFLATIIIVAATVTNVEPACAVVFAALLHAFHKAVLQHARSMRHLILATGYHLIPATLYCAVTVLQNTKERVIPDGSTYSEPGIMDTIAVRTARWTSAFYTLYWGTGPIAFVSLCMRYDYDNHVSKLSNGRSDAPVTDLAHLEDASPELFVLETVPEPNENPNPELGPGVVMPYRIPHRFSKPYFTTSIVSFCLLNIALLSCFGFFRVTTAEVEVILYAAVMWTLSLPVMCAAAFGVAAIRGEIWSLRSYHEVWIRVQASGARENADPQAGMRCVDAANELALFDSKEVE